MRAFRGFILILILYSIVTMTLETMPEMRHYRTFFVWSEFVVVSIFTVEYVVNWVASRNRRYPLTPLAIIDLLAILPFYLQLGVDLRGLRAFRLLRVFRLLKLARYSKSLQLLGEALRRSGPELLAFGFVGLIVIYISAMCLYYAEHNAQPEVFSSIPATFWWAIVTLTTVGYGDVYPMTAIGKVVAAVVMISGVGFVAVPTSIITVKFSEVLRERDAGTL